MVRYTRLWETMREKGVSQYRLITYYKVSAGQIGRLKKNMHVSTHTLEMLCNILQCPVEDILEIVVDPEAGEALKRAAEAREAEALAKAEETAKAADERAADGKPEKRPTAGRAQTRKRTAKRSAKEG